jgi:hypothetical protein
MEVEARFRSQFGQLQNLVELINETARSQGIDLGMGGSVGEITYKKPEQKV